MAWTIIVVEPARSWLHDLRRSDRPTLLLISQAIDALSEEGPALGRPLVDAIKGSTLANLKELRPTSGDPRRRRQGRQLAAVVPKGSSLGGDGLPGAPGADQEEE